MDAITGVIFVGIKLRVKKEIKMQYRVTILVVDIFMSHRFVNVMTE